MVEKEAILSPDKKLRDIKLEGYFDLLGEFNKYRRLVIYKNVNYPIIKWINALLSFYDVMFTEANEEPFKTDYKKLFEAMQELDHRTNVSYEDLLKYTRDMMRFADATGITKISKIEEDESPGGAEYG